MNYWSKYIELREENGIVCAFRINDGRKISIPKFPKPTADIDEWLRGLSLDALEAARQYYQDKWTWDNNAEKYRLLVSLIESHMVKTRVRGFSYCPYVPVLKNTTPGNQVNG